MKLSGTIPNLLNFPPGRSPLAAIAWEIFWPRRKLLLTLALTLLACAAAVELLPSDKASRELLKSLFVLPMALSLGAVFILFKFTEPDSRQLNGFPTRLFKLPASTGMLVSTPLFLAVISVVLLYLAWAIAVLRPAGANVPLHWPCLYLATGMICFQSIVWALARWNIVRLIVLSVFGSYLTVGWLSFTWNIPEAQLGGSIALRLGIPVRTMQMSLLAAIGFAGYCAGWFVVSRQRHGLGFRLPRLRGLRFSKLKSSGETPPFKSPASAQFWFEWNVSGRLLPLSTGFIAAGILAIYTLAIWKTNQRISVEAATRILAWIVFLPLPVAFVIGQAFGKTNFWGKDLGLPGFLAVRPIAAADWVGVKLRTAFWSAVVTWTGLLIMIAVWLVICCDWSRVFAHLRNLMYLYPLAPWAGPGALLGLAITFFSGACILLTWRLLASNIYLGVLGNKTLFNASACFVFVSLLSPPIFAGWLAQHPETLKRLLTPAAWLPWALGTLVLCKLALAVHFWLKARNLGLVGSNHSWNYFAFWMGGTQLLLIAVLLMPVTGRTANVLALLALLALPLARISAAPLAFAHNRTR